MNQDPIIVAIDGYSSSGKSTMAKRLAAAVGYRYVDSGAMYRAITLKAMRTGLAGASGVDEAGIVALLPTTTIDFRPVEGGQVTLLDGEDVECEIRSMEVSNMVSPVSVIPAVRHALTAMQQAFGKSRGIVMDGRDIGTTVFPDAELKVFVDAAPETRAERRFKELTAKGVVTTYEAVLANVTERDEIDRTRKESPLRCADDAVKIDNSGMTLEEQDALLLKLFNDAAGR
ncbi:MAG: (d)CMP kinase [Bacteroides sp.]|nr:(d)CMP kinase [Bacteroides sp.]